METNETETKAVLLALSARDTSQYLRQGLLETLPEDVLGEICTSSGVEGIIRLFCSGSSIIRKKLRMRSCKLELRFFDSPIHSLPALIGELPGITGVVQSSTLEVASCDQILPLCMFPQTVRRIEAHCQRFQVIPSIFEKYSNLVSLSLAEFSQLLAWCANIFGKRIALNKWEIDPPSQGLSTHLLERPFLSV
jgi:hypothetical protein